MTENRKGLLLVVSGPSGSGKGTVNQILLKDPDYTFSVSVTTRAPRPGEIEGKSYRYISREEFDRLVAQGDLLEHTEYCGNGYGTPRKEAEEAVAAGKILLLEIEVAGAMAIKQKYPDAVLVMLLPPSFAELEARLRGRTTETEAQISARIARAKEEMQYLDRYDYIVYNRQNHVEECADEIRAIVRAERCSVRRNPDAKDRFFRTPD